MNSDLKAQLRELNITAAKVTSRGVRSAGAGPGWARPELPGRRRCAPLLAPEAKARGRGRHLGLHVAWVGVSRPCGFTPPAVTLLSAKPSSSGAGRVLAALSRPRQKG